MIELNPNRRRKGRRPTVTYVTPDRLVSTTGPRAEVDRVDALNCSSPAAHRIGSRLVCTEHRLEVLHAYWETDANLALFEVDEAAGYRCGETFPGVSR